MRVIGDDVTGRRGEEETGSRGEKVNKIIDNKLVHKCTLKN
ncbi:MAG: hypothetical protein PWQ14_1135 [Rikenellaceae bacterium]|jgi:hypothetical protein|nr:hypothetical protein [Rikenellaceae bacterium]